MVTYRLATPYSLGIAFGLPGSDRIVTLEHLVRDCAEVLLLDAMGRPDTVPVLWTDDTLDLALVGNPTKKHFPATNYHTSEEVTEVISCAPDRFGQPEHRPGKVTGRLDRPNGATYLVHSALLNAQRSGAPLLSADRRTLLGINTFLTRNGHPVGYALPAAHLETLKKVPLTPERFTELLPHTPQGMARTIEIILERAGHAPDLSRRGPNAWAVQRGSARIELIYSERTGLLSGDAYLCAVGSEAKRDLWEFLLKENARLDGLTLSLRDNHVLLSLLIHDRYLHPETGTRRFEQLCRAADDYDDVLVNRFGCSFT